MLTRSYTALACFCLHSRIFFLFFFKNSFSKSFFNSLSKTLFLEFFHKFFSKSFPKSFKKVFEPESLRKQPLYSVWIGVRSVYISPSSDPTFECDILGLFGLVYYRYIFFQLFLYIFVFTIIYIF